MKNQRVQVLMAMAVSLGLVLGLSRSSADGAIRVAHNYSGSRAPLPEPALDFTRLELAERQARQHKEHLIVLGAINGIPVAGIEDTKEIS